MEQAEKKWYIVNTYSGHEEKVRDNIIRRIDSENEQEHIFRVIVAEEEELVKKDGKPTGKVKLKNIYPGYIFIEMIMTDEAWYVVRNTPGVTGFVGSSGRGTKPFPVPEEEVAKVLKRIGMFEGKEDTDYKVGDEIRVVNGPLANQILPIIAVDVEKKLVTVATIFFGRKNEVSVSFNDIEKI